MTSPLAAVAGVDQSSYRLGADVGGTFTDIVLASDSGAVSIKKVLSTTGQYQRAVADGSAELLAEQGVAPHQVVEVLHGTTVATNAVLERSGAPTGLLTTNGFRDVLELRRLRMPDIYNVFWEKPLPLVPRNLRLEVAERIDDKGRVVVPLQLDQVRESVQSLIRQGITSIAVCLLHSYVNPEHERQIGELIREEFPDLFVTLSHEVQPEIGEYERTSTVVTNAYVMPVMTTYITLIRHELQEIGVGAPLLIVQSSGGMMTSRMAAKQPVFSLESGPAAGVNAALALVRRLGIDDAVTFDMGGTTAKASLIAGGKAEESSEYEVGAPISIASRLLKGGGYLVRVRAIDLAEVGAGGGSVVTIDRGGSLQVGPKSAGASPGPVCYGRGGNQPTVTDSNLLLGYLNQTHLLGGALAVDVESARQVFDEAIAGPLGMATAEAAHAVHIVANAAMARAVRAVTTERGRDVRDFTLVAFGGNGPVHAAELARSLGVHTIVIPPWPGLFSAIGLLTSPLEQAVSQTIMKPTREITNAELRGLYAGLQQRVTAVLADESVPVDAVDYTLFADMHYVGQKHELTVQLPPDVAPSHEALDEAFGNAHARAYGQRSDGEATELINARVVARYSVPPPGHGLPKDDPKQLSTESHSGPRTRMAYFGRDSGHLETAITPRRELSRSSGPLIIEEYDTTIVVPPAFVAEKDDAGNIVLTW